MEERRKEEKEIHIERMHIQTNVDRRMSMIVCRARYAQTFSLRPSVCASDCSRWNLLPNVCLCVRVAAYYGYKRYHFVNKIIEGAVLDALVYTAHHKQ